jgi:hypothetical protein
MLDQQMAALCLLWIALSGAPGDAAQANEPEPVPAASGVPEAQRAANPPDQAAAGSPMPPEAAPEEPFLSTLNQALSQLKAERAAIRSLLDDALRGADNDVTSHAEQTALLRSRLADLLTRLATQRYRDDSSDPNQTQETAAETETPEATKPAPGSDSVPAQTTEPTRPPDQTAPLRSKPVHPMALALVLLRTGDHAGALDAYRSVDIAILSPEDRMAVQYFTATCLRRLGKTQEASTLYREVANSKGDDVLRECARWQLSSIRWRQGLEAQLGELRQRRQAVSSTP